MKSRFLITLLYTMTILSYNIYYDLINNFTEWMKRRAFAKMCISLKIKSKSVFLIYVLRVVSQPILKRPCRVGVIELCKQTLDLELLIFTNEDLRNNFPWFNSEFWVIKYIWIFAFYNFRDIYSVWEKNHSIPFLKLFQITKICLHLELLELNM